MAAVNGIVVTAQHLATCIGMAVLKDGGNAVDAAVAVGHALAFVYAAAGNPGGGGFMTLQLADGRTAFLDVREKAPLAATARMQLDKDGNVVKGAITIGHLAVAVPGTVSGLALALARCGTMKRAALIAPALQLAAIETLLAQCPGQQPESAFQANRAWLAMRRCLKHQAQTEAQPQGGAVARQPTRPASPSSA